MFGFLYENRKDRSESYKTALHVRYLKIELHLHREMVLICGKYEIQTAHYHNIK